MFQLIQKVKKILKQIKNKIWRDNDAQNFDLMKLPKEIRLHIASFLPLESLPPLLLVNNQLNSDLSKSSFQVNTEIFSQMQNHRRVIKGTAITQYLNLCLVTQQQNKLKQKEELLKLCNYLNQFFNLITMGLLIYNSSHILRKTNDPLSMTLSLDLLLLMLKLGISNKVRRVFEDKIRDNIDNIPYEKLDAATKIKTLDEIVSLKMT
ncbi:MAG: hypothetical protein Q8M40_01150 [Legionella sp.]|nr:hypothetical protein [Legionella sp.]